MKLELLSEKNIDEIYEFEKVNKEFFAKSLSPRRKEYFVYNQFHEIMMNFIKDQNNGKCYMHIIRDENHKTIGRINLHSEDGNVFELGYRLGEDSVGLGYGSLAVKSIINEAFLKYGIHKLVAGTSSKNIASQKVLLKNGFRFVKEEKSVAVINGENIDGYFYDLSDDMIGKS